MGEVLILDDDCVVEIPSCQICGNNDMKIFPTRAVCGSCYFFTEMDFKEKAEWYSVETARACGAITLVNGKVRDTAPYFNFLKGKTLAEVELALRFSNATIKAL